MKEQIYTIPLSESFEQNTECPFCYLEKKLELKSIEYSLGAAMMEPDFRVESNEKGYCNKHYSMLFSAPNKLSLALVLDTHLNEVIKKLENQNKKALKKGLFKKNEQSNSEMGKLQNTCMVCQKINDTMERYIDVFFYLLKKEPDFSEKVFSSKGFCLKHFDMLTKKASSDELIEKLYALEHENLKRINEDIHKFTLKFDYRNKDMPWGTAEDAPIRTIEKLGGYITKTIIDSEE